MHAGMERRKLYSNTWGTMCPLWNCCRGHTDVNQIIQVFFMLEKLHKILRGNDVCREQKIISFFISDCNCKISISTRMHMENITKTNMNV